MRIIENSNSHHSPIQSDPSIKIENPINLYKKLKQIFVGFRGSIVVVCNITFIITKY